MRLGHREFFGILTFLQLQLVLADVENDSCLEVSTRNLSLHLLVKFYEWISIQGYG